MSTQKAPDPGVNGSELKRKILELYAELVKQNENIFIRRDDLLEALDEDSEEVNKVIDNTFTIFHEDAYSSYDILYLKPKLYEEKEFDEFMKSLAKAYEAYDDYEIEKLLKSISDIVTLYYLSLYCLRSGEPVAFFLYQALEGQVEFIKDSENTRRFGSVVFHIVYNYINHCFNDPRAGVGIQKGLFVEFSESE